jgi:hypothetical protein
MCAGFLVPTFRPICSGTGDQNLCVALRVAFVGLLDPRFKLFPGKLIQLEAVKPKVDMFDSILVSQK